MPTDDRIPREVLAALQRGSLIEAIRLLRSSGMSLKDAKNLIDAQVRSAASPSRAGDPASVAAPPRAADSSSAATLPRAGDSAASFPAGTTVSPPASVLAALRHGNKIEAITLMRAHAGIGLKEAKDAVDALERTLPPRLKGLSPGEVPPSSGGKWWVVAVILIAAAAWYFLTVRTH